MLFVVHSFKKGCIVRELHKRTFVVVVKFLCWQNASGCNDTLVDNERNPKEHSGCHEFPLFPLLSVGLVDQVLRVDVDDAQIHDRI